MILTIKPQDTLDCANLMSSNVNLEANFVGYTEQDYLDGNRDVTYWLENTIRIVRQQALGNADCLAIKDVDDSGRMVGFLLADCYLETYTNKPVMDVKEMCVDLRLSKKTNAMTVKSCFDYMIGHLKKHGGKDWRADSIREGELGKAYVDFLTNNYNCVVKYGARGIINE